ncbi:hypothetical protein FOVSG1_007869 [Fusarium oxysporum f. sp. vasinfectum]|nr:hypothetical protein H9L39_06834 [Fusarium oxysporum f. sp. albedinis]
MRSDPIVALASPDLRAMSWPLADRETQQKSHSDLEVPGSQGVRHRKPRCAQKPWSNQERKSSVQGCNHDMKLDGYNTFSITFTTAIHLQQLLCHLQQQTFRDP